MDPFQLSCDETLAFYLELTCDKVCTLATFDNGLVYIYIT